MKKTKTSRISFRSASSDSTNSDPFTEIISITDDTEPLPKKEEDTFKRHLRSFTSMLELRVIKRSLVNIKFATPSLLIDKDPVNKDSPSFITHLSIMKDLMNGNNNNNNVRDGSNDDDDNNNRSYCFVITRKIEGKGLIGNTMYLRFRNLVSVKITKMAKNKSFSGRSFSLHHSNSNLLRVIFEDNKYIDFQFLHFHDCEFYYKFLKLVISQKNRKSSSSNTAVHDLDDFEEFFFSGFSGSDIDRFVPLNEEGKGKRKEPLRKSNPRFFDLSSQLAGSDGEAKVFREFLKREFSDWETKHVKLWLRHILFQEEVGDMIMTLYDYILSLTVKNSSNKGVIGERKNLMKNFLNFLKEHTLAVLLKQLMKFERHYSGKKSIRLRPLSFSPKNKKKKLEIMNEYEEDELEPLLRINNDINDNIVIDKRLIHLFEIPKIRESLKYQIQLLKRSGGYFPLSYYQVLKKRIEDHSKRRIAKRKSSSQLLDLAHYENKMKYKERILWDCEECRDCLLFSLLFNVQFKTFLKSKEELFFKSEREFFLGRSRTICDSENIENEKVESLKDERCGLMYDDFDDNEVVKLLKCSRNDEDENIFSKISSSKYDEFLRKMRNSCKCRLDRLSFRIYLRREQNKLRKIKENFERSIQKKFRKRYKLKMKIKEKEEKIKSLDERLLKLSGKILDLEEMNQISIFQRQLDMFSERLKILQTEKMDIQEKFEKMEQELNSKKFFKETYRKLEKMRREMMDCIYELRKPQKFMFLLSNERREEIREIICKRIIGLSKENRRFEIKVKLVLSIERKRNELYDKENREINEKSEKKKINIVEDYGGENKNLVKYLKFFDGSPLFRPDWFRFGFSHSSILLKNLQIHWFSNNLVFIRPELGIDDNYDDIVCFDADCVDLMILDYKSLCRKMMKLAKTMIYWNSFYRYSEWNIFSKQGHKNCQEFTLEMLQALGSIDWFPEIKLYMKDFKNLINDMGNKNVKKKKEKRKNVESFDDNDEIEEEGEEPQKMEEENEKEKIEYFQEQQKLKELRFIHLDEGFCESHPQVLKKYENLIKKDDQNRKSKCIVFRSHSEIDHFIRFCRNVVPDFNLRYAGILNLCKGFDRAFWLRDRKMGGEDVNARPSKEGCVFRMTE